MRSWFHRREKRHWLYGFHARPSSAAIILEDDQKRVLIVKANYKKHWTFPGGIVDAGETPEQAALREIKEEVGLTIDPSSLRFGWVAARHSVDIDTYQFVFKAHLPSGSSENIVLQASEIDEWRLVSKADVLANNLHYAQTVELWAHDNIEGYIEQTFSVTGR